MFETVDEAYEFLALRDYIAERKDFSVLSKPYTIYRDVNQDWNIRRKYDEIDREIPAQYGRVSELRNMGVALFIEIESALVHRKVAIPLTICNDMLGAFQ